MIKMEGDCAVISINNPPVNATSTEVREGLLEAVTQIQDKPLKAAILLCEGRTFIAGGDMKEFDQPPAEPHLPDVVSALETSKIPIIAALHGNVLGGGFEIAMGCAYRIALKKTVCGLPEVNVGLIPGAGGTQRLPRLVGVECAVDMATDGKPRSVEFLYEKGAIDKIVEGDLLKEALDFAIAELPETSPLSQRQILAPGADYFANKRASLTKKAKGQQSPLFNLDAVEWASELPFEQGQPKERELHLALRKSDESKALRHVFFAQKMASSPQSLKGIDGPSIETVAVIGGGLMGSGIAFASLMASMSVILIEVNEAAVEQARGRIDQMIKGAEKRGLVDAKGAADMQSRLKLSFDNHELRNADLVIEAVVEDLGVKREVFQNIASIASDTAILATNTSYLNPDEIFKGLPHPERCLGLHFFAPAHIMKLVEVIQTSDVSNEVLASIFSFVKRLKKTPVLCGICDGFIGNRILSAYRRQADYFLADGALPHEVDAAMRGFGFAVGPYEAQDMSGLQIAWANRKRQADTRPETERYVTIADQICDAGWLGQRTGQGWYKYEDKVKTEHCTPEVAEIIQNYSSAETIDRQEFTADEISRRIMAVIINEGALIVEEGIARQMSDVDIVEVFGFGFPRWRGGPMKYAEMQGAAKIRDAFDAVTRQSPDSWTRSKYLS